MRVAWHTASMAIWASTRPLAFPPQRWHNWNCGGVHSVTVRKCSSVSIRDWTQRIPLEHTRFLVCRWNVLELDGSPQSNILSASVFSKFVYLAASYVYVHDVYMVWMGRILAVLRSVNYWSNENINTQSAQVDTDPKMRTYEQYLPSLHVPCSQAMCLLFIVSIFCVNNIKE